MRNAWRAFGALVLMTAACQRPLTTATEPVQTSEQSVATTTAPAPSAALLSPYSVSEAATRVTTVCVTDEESCHPPETVPDPLDGYHGRYQCRFATAGRVTPCCPNATSTLAQFWAGSELAIADFIVGRESGCNAAIVNSSGCMGWFQLCNWSCNGSCREAYPNAEKAHELYLNRHWCAWVLSGDPVTGRACS